MDSKPPGSFDQLKLILSTEFQSEMGSEGAESLHRSMYLHCEIDLHAQILFRFYFAIVVDIHCAERKSLECRF